MSPEEALAVRVIEQAIHDTFSRSMTIRLDALRFLDSDDCLVWIELLAPNRDPRDVQAAIWEQMFRKQAGETTHG